ncbi:hypothetical protein [Pseudaminobacter soli (ex Li et al. 2025)]|uniref:Uncharacterized protein n=1 Tax=Pseudaminobacter soli (ex Li et al. 2025) TaxID=1295366 RepID=A0A2P7RZY5_9HYPH|nr:hypothetical protein [Mesorhizobium soli]PSJ55753.1 hypothetical protein C7I85_26035 [Mesorhizobium soli]
MATLVITYSCIDASRHYVAPVARGASVRTETVTMPGNGTLSAKAPEEIVELLADVDCWVAIGATPTVSALPDGTRAARKLAAGMPYQFNVSAGEKVAVAAA